MNQLLLAVAGSRKTQSIVDECAATPERRALILTYTVNNQVELSSRLSRLAPPQPASDVLGWYSFLITHIVRPYLPLWDETIRVTGFAFDGPESRFLSGAARHFTVDGAVYKRNLAKLAHDICELSRGAVMQRLSQIYDVVYIDEAQDLCGWDLEILSLLMEADVELRMVGDVRQALLVTNPEDQKNKRYHYMGIYDWFLKQEEASRLEIRSENRTWRSSQAIANFADKIFDPALAFEATVSMTRERHVHEGLFVVAIEDLSAYIASFSPLVLRYSAASWRELNEVPNIMNFTVSKGLTADHVIVCATEPITKHLKARHPLEARSGCSLYVAVTRARHSVAFLVKDPSRVQLPRWRPEVQE